VTQSPLHVLIVGGGLGGLCLAQGLRQAGISTAVYERDSTPGFRRQGYRLHIDARGATALRSCLPSDLFELFLATTSQLSHQITVFNKHLRILKTPGSPAVNNTDPARFSTAVDRLTLREILLAGLDDLVYFNKEYCRYEQLADGSVQVFFADGTDARGDVLVAADGVNSRIRQQLLPEAAVVDTGTRCIYGKTRLTASVQSLLPAALQQGFSVVVGSHASLAMGLVKFLHPPAEAAACFVPTVQFHTSGDYLMWSLNAQRAQFAASDGELFQMNSLQLQELVLRKIKSWHPDLRALIAASESEETFPIAVRVSTPCDPWPATPVTLLGDSIHAMSPAGGSGANMALLDAHLLLQALISVADGKKPLLQALREYEIPMLEAGFAAVRFSANGGVLNASIATEKTLLQRLKRVVKRRWR